MTPIRLDLEAGFWYFYYFLTERGRAGLTKNRRPSTEVIWRRNSPNWSFDDATLDRAADAFDNPDYVDVVLHSYRHRQGLAPGSTFYDEIEQQLAALPPIEEPTITLDGVADGNFQRTAPDLLPISPDPCPPPSTERRPQPSPKKPQRHSPERYWTYATCGDKGRGDQSASTPNTARSPSPARWSSRTQGLKPYPRKLG